VGEWLVALRCVSYLSRRWGTHGSASLLCGDCMGKRLIGLQCVRSVRGEWLVDLLMCGYMCCIPLHLDPYYHKPIRVI